MQNFLDFINNFLAHVEEIKEIPIVSLGLAVLAYLWGRYTNYKENRKKGLSFTGVNYAIAHIDAPLKELQLTFKGKRIKKLNISQFAVWNSGNGTIRNGVDIPKDRPLSVKCQGSTEIMGAKILTVSESANHFQLSFDSKQATLDFEFLEENDGVIVQIFHTGGVYLDAKIIDGDKKIKDASRPMLVNTVTGKPANGLWISTLVGCSVMIICCLFPIVRQIIAFLFKNAIEAPDSAQFFTSLFSLLGLIIVLFFLVKQTVAQFKLYIPQALRHFDELTLDEESDE